MCFILLSIYPQTSIKNEKNIKYMTIMSTALIPTNYYQGFLASEYVSQNLKIYLALTKSFLFFYASPYSQVVFTGERKS